LSFGTFLSRLVQQFYRKYELMKLGRTKGITDKKESLKCVTARNLVYDLKDQKQND